MAPSKLVSPSQQQEQNKKRERERSRRRRERIIRRIEPALEFLFKFFITKGLGKEATHTNSIATLEPTDIDVGSEGDDWNRTGSSFCHRHDVSLADDRCRLESIKKRHFHVHQDQIIGRNRAFKFLTTTFSIFDDIVSAPIRLESAGDDLLVDEVVFGHEDLDVELGRRALGPNDIEVRLLVVTMTVKKILEKHRKGRVVDGLGNDRVDAKLGERFERKVLGRRHHQGDDRRQHLVRFIRLFDLLSQQVTEMSFVQDRQCDVIRLAVSSTSSKT